MALGKGAEAECYRLMDSCATATKSSDHRNASRIAGRLQIEADRIGNPYFLSYALYYQGVSNVILGNSAIGKSQLDKALALAEKIDNDTLRLSIYNGYGVYEANVHINYPMAQRYFYKSLELAVRIGDPMRQALVECNLAEIASIRRDTTGLKYALNCRDWGLANDNPHINFTGAYHCANLYNIAGNHREALRYIKEADMICRRENYAERAAVYNLYGSIYASSGHHAQALEWLHKAEKNISEAQGATITEIYCNYARTLAALGRTAESDRMIRRGLAIADSLQINSSVAQLLEQKALNLESRGDHRRALEVYKIYKQSCDSAYSDRQQQSINELRVQYDTAKREHEADMHRLMLQNERRKTAVLLTILLSVTAILAILWLHYRRQRRIYRKIVISNREALAREEELTHRLTMMQQGSQETADTANGGEAASATRMNPRNDDLFDKLSAMMEHEKVYRDSNLTRERLAELLGTNRTYLTQIITQHTDKGYYQFINAYRIKEAVRILSSAENSDYPLKALASDLGFKSMSTFYKTFQETVGMTPSMYRDTARNL